MGNEIGIIWKIKVKTPQNMEVEVIGQHFGTVDAKFKELEAKYLKSWQEK